MENDRGLPVLPLLAHKRCGVWDGDTPCEEKARLALEPDGPGYPELSGFPECVFLTTQDNAYYLCSKHAAKLFDSQPDDGMDQVYKVALTEKNGNPFATIQLRATDGTTLDQADEAMMLSASNYNYPAALMWLVVVSSVATQGNYSPAEYRVVMQRAINNLSRICNPMSDEDRKDLVNDPSQS